MANVQFDRIEGEMAVLVYQGESFDVPAALLPPDAREGDTLAVTFTREVQATQDARESLAELRARLNRRGDGGDFSL